MSLRRRVVVTGASSGIGRATAVRFAADGYDVCLTARRQALLQEVASGLAPGAHLVYAGDYSDPGVVEGMGRVLRERWRRVDALVNCAGIWRGAAVVDSPLTEWQIPFDTMVRGALLVTRAVVPLMTEGGRIIHVTSIHSQRAEAGSSSYAMAKAALDQFCRALAVELAPRGILANAIAPGFVDTPMCIGEDGVNELETEWFRANYVEGHHLPLRRAARPEEIAGVAAFLAGPDASYITGQVMVVDGGLTITF